MAILVVATAMQNNIIIENIGRTFFHQTYRQYIFQYFKREKKFTLKCKHSRGKVPLAKLHFDFFLFKMRAKQFSLQARDFNMR